MAIKLTKNLILSEPIFNNGAPQINNYIVIHSSSGKTAKDLKDDYKLNTNKSNKNYGALVHYVVDDKSIYQLLEDNWGAKHCGNGESSYSKWSDGISGISDANSIGIEIAKGSSVDILVAIENAIELARFLMQTYGIKKVVRHCDVADKACPAEIVNINKWDYMLKEISKRNTAKTKIKIDTTNHNKSNMVATDTEEPAVSPASNTTSSEGRVLQLVFNDTTTVQESLPNANTSDNWVDMHKIKGITLHMYPPYHNCSADSMAKRFKTLNWKTNFHYKVDKDTKIDFSKKPVSGQTRGGNVVGSSESDFEVKPKDPLYSGVVLDGNGNPTNSGGDGLGDTTPARIYNYCKAQGCTDEAAAGIVANCECETHFDCSLVNSIGASGLFQWLGGRFNALKAKAKAANKDWTDVDLQIQHMWSEFTGEDSTTVSLLKKYGGIDGYKSLTDAGKAGDIFGRTFERGDFYDVRAARARKWIELIKVKDFTKCADGSKLPDNAIFSSSNTPSGGVFGWPIPGVSRIPSGGRFGDPRDGGARKHKGIDVSCAQGTEIHAYAAGKVVVASYGYNYGRGNYVKLEHEPGCYTWYVHIVDKGIKVKTGDTVSAGQVIALVGNTGASTGPHLHFEIWKNNVAVDPLGYVTPGGGAKGASTSTSRASTSSNIIPRINTMALSEENDKEPFGWPIPKQSYISSYYGYRTDIKGHTFHPGIDIAAYMYTPVMAYADGVVEKVEKDTILNGYVKINHGNGVKTVYGSLDNNGIYVEEGDNVVGGQNIGSSYKTISNELMHAHFEMWIDGKRVDPLIYVNPGGGNKKIPDALSKGLIRTFDIGNENDEENITWDNIDKGKIVFAAYQNNQHTYIDANLFNNQHPKYTLSIGAFFYDEFDLVEKSDNISWPETEKKLIEQCAKALYDEGFTSTQLWREFDLNRAPSPFLYLDKNNWIEFCKEVDSQVEWLNAKYGKVTSTYVPNNLLTDQNDNEFVETAPDGGVQNGSPQNPGSGSGITDLQKGLFIGSDWGAAIESSIESEGAYSENYHGKDCTYFYLKSKKVDRISKMPSDAKFVYVYLGLNEITNKINETQIKAFLDALKNKYNNIPIFIGKMLHVGKNYSSYKNFNVGADNFNKLVDSYNKIISSYCSKNSINFLDISNGLVDDKGYLINTESNSVHLKDYNTYFSNIKNALSNSSSSIPEEAEEENDSPEGESDTSSEDIQADVAYKGKYAWVGVYDSRMYKGPDTATDTVSSLEYGQEAYIVGAKGIFYQVVVDGRAGYIRAKNLCVITGSKKYGPTYSENKNKTATLLPGTILYHTPAISDNSNVFKTYSSRKTCTIVNTADNFYYVKVDDIHGYVKAYRCRVSSNPVSTMGVYTIPSSRAIVFNALQSDMTADEKNIGKYCYYGNTESGHLYSKADESSDSSALCLGDEMKITGVSTKFYKVTFNKKTGYVDVKDVAILASGHGEVNTNKLKQTCYVKWDNVTLYTSTSLDKTIDVTLLEKTKGIVTELNKELGLYKVSVQKEVGWIKAYCLTFEYDYFRVEKDSTTNVLVPGGSSVVNPTPDSENDNDDNVQTPEDETLDIIPIDGGDFNDSTMTGWEEEGTLDFNWVENPAWGSEGHWPYRGEGFARIRNINKKLAGIKHEINFDESEKDKNFYLRVLVWVKQVTQNDTIDGPANHNTLKSNGLYLKILDKNNKVKYERKIDLAGLTDTTWSRVGCLFSDVAKDDAYEIFIGNNNTYDLYIDDLTIEKIYIDKIDDTIGDSDTTSGIDKSGVGTTAIDNGGVMIYEIGKPTNPNAGQPTIKTIISHEDYEKIMEYSKAAYIDNYTNSFEPYDKDLAEAKIVGVTDDIRLDSLTEEMKTFTDNMIRYKVVETGTGSIDHCVKPVDELNVLYKASNCQAEPIYPDLIIPPKYSTSDYDIVSKNSLPLFAVQKGTIEVEDAISKSLSYDYSLLDKKEKVSTGRPINYDDPYPYDDKIHDLENHSPKVLIDEIESRLYSCNHPGCPIAHPMAKNFAMLSDMSIRQSKATEQRIVRLENILATMVRNMGRVGSRVNINCVYYGGQDVFSKYRSVRCLHDDRVHDGCSVTIDQCLCCTRYEPIIGQIYDILDETGFNGSAILDDMQMSYMELDDFKNLNDVSRRSSKWSYINSNKKQDTTPTSIIDKWKKEDKEYYISNLKKKISDKNKLDEELKNIEETDYIFRMDWTEDDVDMHAPDIKPYPTEKIAAKYKNQFGDPADNDAPAEKNTQLGDNREIYESLASSTWVDTRKKDDTIQKNKYTSLDFYFENFNLNRTGYEYDNGLKGNIGLSLTGSIGGTTLSGAECRKKICDTALAIVEQHKNKQACYSNSPRTIDMDKPQKISGNYLGMSNPIGYDCTSFVSCCYKAAGLNSFYDGRTGQGNVSANTLVQEVLKKGGKIWFADAEGMAKAMPGDVMMTYKHGKLDKSKIEDGSDCKATHAMIYMGEGMIAHSSLPKAAPDGILYQKADYYVTGTRAGHSFFIRPQELIDADNASNTSNGIEEVAGSIDGHDYVAKLGDCVLTQYGTWDGSSPAVASGKSWSSCVNASAASHNLPYGTKIYCPDLKGKYNSTGIFTVEDTGGCYFDFDMCTSSRKNIPPTASCYVLSYGSGKVAASYTKGIAAAPKYESGFKKNYLDKGGKLVNFFKFNNEDMGLANKYK